MNTWKFSANSVTVNDQTVEAKYSLARGGDVYVFATLAGVPVRVHIGQDMPMYKDALAVAQPKAEKPAEPAQPKAEKPAKVAAQPKAEKPAKPAQPKAEKPAKVAAQPKAEKPAKPAQPKAEKPAQPKAEKPAKVAAQPKAEKVEKPWIGTMITGKGWNIAFDAQAGRTRVLFQHQPTDAQKAAIESAGFYWSSQMNSWNKGLTCKAYRAAQALAATLNALA